MKPKSLLWGELPWNEIQQMAESGAVAVVPFGSTEQHGPMLPVDTDIRIAEKASFEGARVAAEKHGARVLVMPTLPFGLAQHHMRFAGTVTLQPETYVTVVAEILGCAVAHGFRKIAVFSGHGGNEPGLQLGIKKAACSAARPVRIALFRGWQDPEFARLRQDAFGGLPPEGQIAIHASRPEVAGTLADRPHLVRRDRMTRPQLKVESVPEWSWMTHELSETGAFGDPSLATPELGHRIWEILAEAVALFIKRLWLAELPD